MAQDEKQMTLNDVARYINLALSKSEIDGKEPVIVTLNGRHEGKRSYVNIRYIGHGKEEDGEDITQ